jgi:rhodanese-related sulfurtransferase
MPQTQARIFQTPAAAPLDAQVHFASRLALETDPGEVNEALQAKAPGLVVVDARGAEAFAKGHIPGAINLPAKLITPESTAGFDKHALYVSYCGSVTCRASTRAAEKLAGLGFQVKELLGGIETWQEKGFAVEPAQA